MSKSNTGVIFARVKSKAKNTRRSQNGWEYSLSNGATMFLPNPNLQLGSWNFFEVEYDKFRNMHYVSHCALSKSDGEMMEASIADLKAISHQMSQMWIKLENEERQICMRTVGIGLTAFGAGSVAYGAATAAAEAIAEEALLSVILPFGIGIAVSAGLAGLSYLQYEEKKQALKGHTRTLKSFMAKRSAFAAKMSLHVPAKYRFCELYDPQVQGIVTRVRLMYDNFDWESVFVQDDNNFSWSAAAA